MFKKVAKRLLQIGIIASFALILAGCGAKGKLDVSEIVELQYEGKHEEATAEVILKEKALKNSSLLEEAFPDLSKEKAQEKLQEVFKELEFKLDKSSDLANGDTVTVTVEAKDEKVLKDNKLKLTEKEFTIKVKGLSTLISIDPFEGFELKYSGSSPHATVSYDASNTHKFVQDYVTFNIEYKKYANGDTVEVNADFREEVATENGLEITETQKIFTVEGLPTLETIDPFDGFKLSYEGVSPGLTVSFDASNTHNFVQNYVNFSIERKKYANGDTVEVTANFYEEDAISNGYHIKETTKTYTIEGQSEHIKDITTDLDLSALQAEIDDKLTAGTATNSRSSYFVGVYLEYKNFKSIKSSKLLSTHLNVIKDQYVQDVSLINKYILIYEYNLELVDGKTKKVYVAVTVDNVSADTEGKVSWAQINKIDGNEDYEVLMNSYINTQKEKYIVKDYS